jgi:hypothetical protein
MEDVIPLESIDQAIANLAKQKGSSLDIGKRGQVLTLDSPLPSLLCRA